MNRLIHLIILAFLLTININSLETVSFNESKDKKVVLIFNNSTFDESLSIKKFISDNKDRIDYEVDIVFTNDDYIKHNHFELISYLDNSLILQPSFFAIFNYNKQNNIELVFSDRVKRFPFSIRKALTQINENHIEDSYLSILKILNINKDNRIPYKITKIKSPILFIQGMPETLKYLETLLDSKNNDLSLYISIPLWQRVIDIKERFIILTFIIFIALLSTLLSAYSRRIKFHIRQNKKYLYTLGIKAFALFFFYYIATLFIEQIIFISGDENIVANYPISFFIIKNLTIFFIYGICFHVIKDTNFSKSPYFYSYISFFLSIAIFFVMCFISLSVAIFQIVPILLIILFISSKHRSSKRFFLNTAPLLLLLFFIRYLRGENIEFLNLFIHSRFKGNLILTTFTLPYIFLQDSYHRFLTRRQNKLIYRKDIVFSLLLLMVTITYIAIILELNKL